MEVQTTDGRIAGEAASWIDALRERRDEVLAAWVDDERFVKSVESGAWLDDVIERAIEIDAGRAPSQPRQGFDRRLEQELAIGQIVEHYAALRDAIALVLERDLSASERIRAYRAVGRSIDVAVASVMEDHARAHRETTAKAASELRFLADATAALAASLNYDETLDQVARLAVPVLADWCVVDLVDDTGAVRRVSIAHREPSLTALAQTWADTYLAQKPDQGVLHVIRTGWPELATELPERPTADAHHTDTLRAMGVSPYVMSSYMIVPLRRGDHTLGAITLVRTSPEAAYTESDLELATELAHRAALAIENARLFTTARDAIAARDRLIAFVAHDLRSPLNAIGLMVSILRKRHPDDADRADIDIIAQSVDWMKRMISDLLDMSRLEGGRFVLARVPIAAGEIVRRAVEVHAVLATESGIDLRSEPAPDVRVSCDPTRIEQVLGNLVGNALKFGRRGDSIVLSVIVEGNEARFQVADTGPGIPPENLPHIFELFWSAKQGNKEGLGLGLYISKRIVEAHGGRIWADSQLGEGTTVFFTLPLAD